MGVGGYPLDANGLRDHMEGMHGHGDLSGYSLGDLRKLHKDAHPSNMKGRTFHWSDTEGVEDMPGDKDAHIHRGTQASGAAELSPRTVVRRRFGLGKADICKVDEDQRIVFGWAYVTHDLAGQLNVDKSGEFIDDPEELATAAYDFVLESRHGGQNHQRDGDNPVVKSTMIESMVFTPEKLEAMGVSKGVLPIGWWTGWKVHDDGAWADVKEGRAKSFSIHGTGSKMAT